MKNLEFLKLHAKCECQHDVHFCEPFTNQRHEYAQVQATVVLKTPLIKQVAVCKFCADNCMSIYSGEK